MRTLLSVTLLIVTFAPAAAAKPNEKAKPAADVAGIRVHVVESEYQPKPTKIRVLVPDSVKKEQGRAPRVLYVLPVEAGEENRYGGGLNQIKKHELHNKHNVICVAPTFVQLPWYADHPTDPKVRQESHFIKAVVPLVDKLYLRDAKRANRFLLGFSKSGWGAWSLLLRHPDMFERASAWDSPMDMKRYGLYGSKPIFGSQENFEKYRVRRLLEQQASELEKANRLVLTGYGNPKFRAEQQAIHALLKDMKIPHDYRDGPQRKHRWNGGWLSESMELLLGKPVAGRDSAP